MRRRDISELLDTSDPAWPMVQSWILDAGDRVEVLPPSDKRAEALVDLQMTLRAPMAAVVYETGGLLVDHGWLRFLGSGHPRLPRTLPGWNRDHTWPDPNESPPLLLVADDVIGGSFGINGGAFEGKEGQVYYFAPDTLDWENLGIGYSNLLEWALSPALADFYAASRWPGWEADAAQVNGDRSFSTQPSLWTKGPPIAKRDRRQVPVDELYTLQMELANKL